MRKESLNTLTRYLVLGALIALVPAVAADAATYEIDGVHSSALFKVKHFGTSNFYGAFREIKGSIDYDAAAPEGMGIAVEISSASVDTRFEQRDNHVKSPDFLNAAEFPAISFKSTSVTANGDDTFAVTGNLTLHGVTKEIQVTAEKVGEGEHPRSGKQLIGFEARFVVDRTEFDMGFMAGPLSEEVEFLISLEAGK